MFGYVNIDKPELRIKDYELYRAVYCSQCRTLGKNYSPFSRILLNYDCTFLSLFILSRSEECPKTKGGRCPFNPAKKCNYLSKDSVALKKGAALTVISSYYKLKDNIADSSFFKKALYISLYPLFSFWHKKAAKEFAEYENAMSEMFFMQQEVESLPEPCLDMAAEPTAKMLSRIFSMEAKNDKEKLALKEFGYHLGRWIYLTDAAADMKKDEKSKNFNPFLKKYKSLENADFEDIKGIITQSHFLLTQAYDLIEFNRFKDTLDNIIYTGLEKSLDKALNPKGKDNE